MSEQAKRFEMATQAGACFIADKRGSTADQTRAGLLGHQHLRRMMAAFASATLLGALAIALAPASAASTADLKFGVESARGGCPPLQWDPVLVGVAQRATHETGSYVAHTARFQPFEDPMPVLRDLGYKAGKAKLLVGYGDVESSAIHGLVLQGWEAIPDCTYTRYGANEFQGEREGREYVFAAVVLAGD